MKSRLNYIFEEEAEYKSNHMLNKSSNEVQSHLWNHQPSPQDKNRQSPTSCNEDPLFRQSQESAGIERHKIKGLDREEDII